MGNEWKTVKFQQTNVFIKLISQMTTILYAN